MATTLHKKYEENLTNKFKSPYQDDKHKSMNVMGLPPEKGPPQH